MAPLKTIPLKINGERREMPVEEMEGCPDFDFDEVSGKLLFGNYLKEWDALYGWQKRHAACVAAAWYGRLAAEDCGNENNVPESCNACDFSCIQYPMHLHCEKHPQKRGLRLGFSTERMEWCPLNRAVVYKSAAAAWGAVVDELWRV